MLFVFASLGGGYDPLSNAERPSCVFGRPEALVATIAGKGREVGALRQPMLFMTAALTTFAPAMKPLLCADWPFREERAKSETQSGAKHWDVLGGIPDSETAVSADKGGIPDILDAVHLAA